MTVWQPVSACGSMCLPATDVRVAGVRRLLRLGALSAVLLLALLVPLLGDVVVAT